LTDDWDQEFGYRTIEAASGQRTKIGLFRESDGSWLVDASASGSDVATMRSRCYEPSWFKESLRRGTKRP